MPNLWFLLRWFDFLRALPPFLKNHKNFLRLVAFDGYIKLDEFYTSGVGVNIQFSWHIYCYKNPVFSVLVAFWPSCSLLTVCYHELGLATQAWNSLSERTLVAGTDNNFTTTLYRYFWDPYYKTSLLQLKTLELKTPYWKSREPWQMQLLTKFVLHWLLKLHHVIPKNWLDSWLCTCIYAYRFQ